LKDKDESEPSKHEADEKNAPDTKVKSGENSNGAEKDSKYSELREEVKDNENANTDEKPKPGEEEIRQNEDEAGSQG